jgi:flagellar biosynthesis/type III secretory pathway M-ring protein FliF/YscJ
LEAPAPAGEAKGPTVAIAPGLIAAIVAGVVLLLAVAAVVVALIRRRNSESPHTEMGYDTEIEMGEEGADETDDDSLERPLSPIEDEREDISDSWLDAMRSNAEEQIIW